MKKNISSVFLAVFLSVSMLSINCSAFTFDGENRSLSDIYSDWFISTRDFCSGNKSFEEWRNDNVRFQTDIIGSNLFPGSDAEFRQYISDIENQLSSAAESTDNKVDDTFIDIFGKAVECVGVFDFRGQFESWYQDKYGKEYGKHDNAFGGDLVPNTTYYVKLQISSLGQVVFKTLYFNSNSDYFPVYSDGNGYKYVAIRSTDIVGTSYYVYRGYEDPYQSFNGKSEGSVVGQYTFGCPYDYSTTGRVIAHNLPLQFNGSDYGDDSFQESDPDSEPELIAPGLTLPEIGDLLTDLNTDVTEADNPDNPNKGLEIKITQLTNKLHADLSKVIEYLKQILLKISDFFDNFFGRLSDFFQSVFIPQDDYFSSAIMDIKAEFDEAFSFAGDLRFIVDSCFSAYKNGGTNPPEININIDGYGTSHKLDFSIFDKSIPLVRSVICAICYASFALSTYRRIPLYISGGGDR